MTVYDEVIINAFDMTKQKLVDLEEKFIEAGKKNPKRHITIAGEALATMFLTGNKLEGEKKLSALRDKWPEIKAMKQVVYIVTVPLFSDFPFSDRKKLKERRAELMKKSNGIKNIAMCDVNDQTHWEAARNAHPCCLYVGSSSNMYSRLLQHWLGSYCSSVSAMHLTAWWPKENENVQFDIWDMSDVVNNDTELQTIEDALWDTRKPLLGRKGTNQAAKNRKE
jgi:hypothetical protein